MEIFEAAWRRKLRGKRHKLVELKQTVNKEKEDLKVMENVSVVKIKGVMVLMIVSKKRKRRKVEKKGKQLKKKPKKEKKVTKEEWREG